MADFMNILFELGTEGYVHPTCVHLYYFSKHQPYQSYNCEKHHYKITLVLTRNYYFYSSAVF